MSWDSKEMALTKNAAFDAKAQILVKCRIEFENKIWEYYIDKESEGLPEWLDDILDRLERAERKKIR